MSVQRLPGRQHKDAPMHAGLGVLLTAQIISLPHTEIDDPDHLSFTGETWKRIACMYQRGLPAEVDVSNDDSCWRLNLTAARGYPTIHLKITAQRIDKRFNAHRLMFKMYHPEVPMTLGDRTQQVSHRCGVTSCVNPKHLVLEDDKTNKSRNYCRNGATHLCPHTPKCAF